MDKLCRDTCLLLVMAGATGNLLAANDAPAPTVHLTGPDLSAWRGDTGQWLNTGDALLDAEDERLLSTKAGTGVLVNGATGRTVHLLSKQEFGDIRAHIEFMVAKDSNSGVYFMGRYELQVFDSWEKTPEYPGIECGGIYERWDENRTPKGYEGHSARLNVSRPPGQWQTFDVVFRAPRFDNDRRKLSNARFERVVHNGVVIHEDIEVTGPTRASAFNDEQPLGPLMLQGDHGPVAYRNIRLAPAGPNPFFAMDTGTKDAKHQTAAQQAEMLAELGYAGIGGTLEAGPSLVQMLAELDKRGLRLFALYAGINLESEQPYEPTLGDAMKTLDGRNTILWLFIQSSKLKPSAVEGDARATGIISELADLATEHHVRIALYPHTGFWLERVEDAVRLAGKIDRPNVGVTFNLCHWLRVSGRSNLEGRLRAAMPHLFAVTINGADVDGQDWNRLIQTLDRGTFDLEGFLRTLGEAGYTGPIGLQGYGIGGDVHDNLKRSMQAWQRYGRILQPGIGPFGRN